MESFEGNGREIVTFMAWAATPTFFLLQSHVSSRARLRELTCTDDDGGEEEVESPSKEEHDLSPAMEDLTSVVGATPTLTRSL
jgi:hypothetical protein